MSNFLSRRYATLWAVFATGALFGLVAASFFGPDFVAAAPDNANGLPHQNQREIERLNALLSGLTQTEDGVFVFAKPVELRKSTLAVELLVDCGPDADGDRPSLRVCGPARFEAAVGPSCVVVNDRGSAYPEPDFAGPALKVVGPSLFTGDAGPEQPLVAFDPIMLHPGKPEVLVKGPVRLDPHTLEPSPDEPMLQVTGLTKLAPLALRPGAPVLRVQGTTELLSPAGYPAGARLFSVADAARIAEARRITNINPYGIELLVRPTPDAPAESTAAMILDEDEEYGSRLGVGRIDADTIRANHYQTPPQ